MAPAEGRGVPGAPHQERGRQEKAGDRRCAEEDRAPVQHGCVPSGPVQVGLSPDGAADRACRKGNVKIFFYGHPSNTAACTGAEYPFDGMFLLNV